MTLYNENRTIISANIVLSLSNYKIKNSILFK